jgi:ATP/maltotriose-dependent transcriptional regulator MalT
LVLHASAGPCDWLALDRLPPAKRWPRLRAFLGKRSDEALLVIDAIDSLPAAAPGDLRDALADRAPGVRLLLTARSAAALPLDDWRAEGAVYVFDRAAILPTQADWRRAFGEDAGQAADWLGWWSLRRAGEGAAEVARPALVDWLRRVYLASLEPFHASVLGALALCDATPPEALASWLGGGAAQLGAAVHALARDGAPLIAGQVHPAFSASIAAAWQLQQPELASRCVNAALAHALALRDAPRAARLARISTDPGACCSVLEVLGWPILLGAARSELGDMLARLSPEASARPAMQLLRAAWWVEVQRAPVEAERLLLSEGLSGPIADTIIARCKLMYDDPAGARQHAQAALAALPAAGAPAALLAAFASGCAWLDLGWPQQAASLMLDVVRAARRDGLIQLELDGLHVLARAQQEAGDYHGLAVSVQQARERLADRALHASAAAQSLARLALLDAHECLLAPEPIIAPPADSEYFAFPWLVARARVALFEGRIGAALSLGETLTNRLHATYCSEKWKLEAAQVSVWLAGLRGDAETLLGLAGDDYCPHEEAGLHAWSLAVLRAAAALLASRPWPAPRVAELRAALDARGLRRLGATAALVAALGDRDDPLPALGDWLRAAAQTGRVLDACWLAPRLLDPLARWLRHPQAVADPKARELGLALFARLQAPVAGSPPPDMSKRPADLTEREWQVLQLIGQQFSNEQIATTLHVSLPTIKTHINRLYAKLGVASRAEAMQRARALAA